MLLIYLKSLRILPEVLPGAPTFAEGPVCVSALVVLAVQSLTSGWGPTADVLGPWLQLTRQGGPVNQE